MASSRTRRTVVLVALLAGAVGAIASYRRRELDRNTREFHARYD